MQQEVNADLWRDNRRRKKLAWTLLIVALLGILLFAVLRPHGVWRDVLALVIVGFLIGHRILFDWSRSETQFLGEDQFKDSPRLWK